ncbi:Xylosidase glycosyl [Mycena sanguinolenta]|uniref:Xylosidase glycosyl n=1 Tax=Mycena sanguinolenta TaxID=230812 RepID=A0A8H6Z9W7_9AGAR|nr:Xylosidase glycosyl [Mycena sanguinolenta]
MPRLLAFGILLAATRAVLSQVSTPFGQCAGEGYTGPTVCPSGWTCVFSNPFYSQCLQATTTTTSTTTNPSPPATSTQTSTSTAAVPTGTFTNPVIWEDLADNDVFRVNDTYYYSASTMHYSPGAPLLRSFDLVNWEYIGHSVPVLDFNSKYNLEDGEQAYVKGIWASTVRFRESNGLWYWYGCIEFTLSYVFTAPSPTGPWTQGATFDTCFYDCGLLIDDDDTMYIVYGAGDVSVSQLSSDGMSIVKTAQVFDTSAIGTMEGNRFYKRNGIYYVADDLPAVAEYVWQSSSVWGPYTSKNLLNSIPCSLPSVDSFCNPHQGSLVDTPSGQWYHMSFTDAYPGGRIPILAPITWGSDGFPALTTVNGAWGASFPYPAVQTTVTPMTGTDTFAGTALGPMWEWNHNPDTTSFTVNDGLTLRTATVTDDLYAARNTLTRRIHGPIGTGTVVIDFTNMADGDRVGLAAFRHVTAWIGVLRDGNTYSVGFTNNITQSEVDWSTTSIGTTVASVPIAVKKIWLRVVVNVAPETSQTAVFSYSLDGNTFTGLGPSFTLNTDWQYFMGYRYGIFNYATKAVGGSVAISSFTSAFTSV